MNEPTIAEPRMTHVELLEEIDRSTSQALLYLSRSRNASEQAWWRGVADELFEASIHLRRAAYRSRQYP